VRVSVLGPVEVVVDGVPVDAGTRKQRAILAALVLHRPHVVPVDTLVEAVWGDKPPPSPLSSLHVYISGCDASSNLDGRRVNVGRCC
jgi:DNA-binding SARP family transcriptional activator